VTSPANEREANGATFTASGIEACALDENVDCPTESVDSAAISALAGRVRGMESVGLKAVAFVSDT
jgi:hypothetical protein